MRRYTTTYICTRSFKIIVFVRIKVRFEELAMKNVLLYGQKHYFEATSTNIRSSITMRTVFDEESP